MDSTHYIYIHGQKLAAAQMDRRGACPIYLRIYIVTRPCNVCLTFNDNGATAAAGGSFSLYLIEFTTPCPSVLLQVKSLCTKAADRITNG